MVHYRMAGGGGDEMAEMPGRRGVVAAARGIRGPRDGPSTGHFTIASPILPSSHHTDERILTAVSGVRAVALTYRGELSDPVMNAI